MKYYRIVDDDTPSRWYLGGLWDNSGVRLDARDCIDGKPLNVLPDLVIHDELGGLVAAKYPLKTKQIQPGVPLDFTLDSSDVPIVRAEVAQVVSRIAPSAIQAIPIDVETLEDRFYILNVTARVDALDRAKSSVELWQVEDGRPEQVGKPKIIYDLVISASLAKGHAIFRVADWEIALIVSDVVRSEFVAHGFRGITFLPV